MRKIVACAMVTLSPMAVTAVPAAAIVGGQDATATTAPYQVAIRVDGWFGKSMVCGGFLLSANKVVTAAQCVDRVSTSKVEVAWGGLDSNDLPSKSAITKISMHPRYDAATLAYDVAVLTLSTAASETGSVKMARLANSAPAAGQDVTVTGWGRTERDSPHLPTQLQSTQLPVLNQQSCNAAYGPVGGGADPFGLFCAGPADGSRSVCTGDAGGPAVVDGLVVGIISGRGCGEPGSPSLFSSAATFKSWLESQ